MTTFATLLRHHREAKRWSQLRLANESNLDHSLVSRLESGDRKPTPNSVYLLSEALGLSEAQSDALWLTAGLIPPSIDTDLLARLVAIIREAQAPDAQQKAA